MSDKDTENRLEAARILGMKPSEILEVKPADDGVLVRTHDGNWTLIREDNSFEFRGKDPNPPAVDEAEAEESEPKPAPKGRGRA